MASISKLLEIEEELRTANLSVAHLCRRAGINQTTWFKWKHKAGAIEKAQPRTWTAVEQARSELLGERAA
jgi:hypothetical protein